LSEEAAAADRIELLPIAGIGEVAPGADLGQLIAEAIDLAGIGLSDEDVVVVTQKVVSKAEGRVVALADVEPSPLAKTIARRWAKDARQVELVLRESDEIVRIGPGGLIISRTRHGFVCANAGVDVSNVGGGEMATLLPVDPDGSARQIREALRQQLRASPAVVISDSFGRPWRNGIVNVAVGAAGLEPLLDLRGTPDTFGRVMQSTVVAVADEIASAADLAGGKVSERPVVVVRGYRYREGDAGATSLVMPPERDLFR
jgi:coenzyme F420-0:L-glutamate ligase/coenzyme F420-1:gamma-L-glutamate ligase